MIGLVNSRYGDRSQPIVLFFRDEIRDRTVETIIGFSELEKMLCCRLATFELDFGDGPETIRAGQDGLGPTYDQLERIYCNIILASQREHQPF
ncbi:MAG: hypothetical protein AAB539_01905 [Patescibacteria group bacterium]